MCKRAILIIFVILFFSLLYTVKVEKIKIEDFEDFKNGIFKNIIISGDGSLRIGPKTQAKNSPEEEYYLSLCSDKKGNIYIGTGHEASIYKLSPDNTVKRIFKTDHLDIYAMEILGDGTLLAGVSPSGKIFKISKNNKSSVFFDPQERMIWDLVEDYKGNIFCAVGAQGGVYKISKNGTGIKIPGINDYHILRLFVSKDNRLLIGSGESGILFQYENNKSKVLFDSPYKEIKGICEDDQGNIYFSGTMDGYFITPLKIQNGKAKVNNLALLEIPKKAPKPIFYKSILYKMDRSGLVEELWKLKNEYIYDVIYDPKSKGVVVATGNSGRIYQVKSDGSYSLLHQGNFSQAYKLGISPNGLLFISNNSPSLIQLSSDTAQKGEYVSEVYDMKVKSKIGKFYWNHGFKDIEGLNLYIRTGNTSTPDSSWEKWSGPFFDKENSTINLSGFRYFQIKVLLNDLNINYPAFLKNISIYYLQSNIQPRIKSVKVKMTTKEKQNKISIKWKTSDRNSDRLNFSLFLKPLTENKWIELKKKYKKDTIEIDPQLFKDGIYHVKVQADDSLDNPPLEVKTTSKVSDPFIIDSTAPVVEDFLVLGTAVSFKVRDKVSVINKVQYSYDRNNWYLVFPKDKINDSKVEEFSISTKNNSYLFIKITDEALNEKVFQKVLH